MSAVARPRRLEGGPDPDLVDVLAAQVDRAAFAVLYRRYLDRVYGYCFKKTDGIDFVDFRHTVYILCLDGSDVHGTLSFVRIFDFKSRQQGQLAKSWAIGYPR